MPKLILGGLFGPPSLARIIGWWVSGFAHEPQIYHRLSNGHEMHLNNLLPRTEQINEVLHLIVPKTSYTNYHSIPREYSTGKATPVRLAMSNFGLKKPVGGLYVAFPNANTLQQEFASALRGLWAGELAA